eukprot:CAMPEP_0185034388 /NCGR_PEP_ID=MMETSP1103-20130426/24249_1 /TAXON_ID=36769 /ORGANISM="Paraphysomonas bandaiensis, Strain Caron Lab Isolate" /LENGTH=1107 /DNA_ID=CAMNT_0027571029 /DNA_START=1161 /DNA_END=4484 /DNA_ORIENTATION=+
MSVKNDEGQEVTELYLGIVEDYYATQSVEMIKGSDLQCMYEYLTAEVSDNASRVLREKGIDVIDSVVCARYVIRDYVRDVCSFLSTSLENDTDFPRCTDDSVATLLCECDEAVVYFMKVVREVAGNDMLVEYLKRPNGHPALPSNARLLCNRKGLGCMVVDPFCTMHGRSSYISACEAYKLSIFQNGPECSIRAWHQKMQQSNTLNTHQAVGLIFGAFFTQRSCGDDTTSLESWISSLSPSHQNSSDLSVWRGVLRWIQSLPPRVDRNKRELLVEQLIAHVGILAVEHPQFYLGMAIHNPSELKNMYLPSMPRSEMEMLTSAMGYVGWYKCRNGHPYTVGECTFPMEKTRCSAPGCGALIGGTNHTSVTGTTRLGIGIDHAEPGYFTDDTLKSSTYKNSIATMAMRFMLHAAMIIGASSSQFTQRQLAVVMKLSQPKDIMPALWKRLKLDFRSMKSCTSFTEEDLCMGLHMVFSSLCNRDLSAFYGGPKTNGVRVQLENFFQATSSDPVFASTQSREIVRKAREENTGAVTVLMLADSLGRSWSRILESPLAESDKTDHLPTVQSYRELMWRVREPVSFESFTRWFRLRSRNAVDFPVIEAVLSNEATLPLVEHIADILAWQSFLFSVLPSTITRDQASMWSNSYVIDTLAPADKRDQARGLLSAFCTAFNKSFHLVKFLYECNPNPFITEDGVVDLTGGKRGELDGLMGEKTTINFSLPTAFHGETEAAGLCTIRLLTALQDCHNRIVASLTALPEKSNLVAEEESHDMLEKPVRAVPLRRPGMTPSLRQQRDQEQQQEISDRPENEIQLNEMPRVPVVSHRTPIPIIRHRLLRYDRLTTLMPIVSAAAHQGLGPGGGHLKGFNFQRIDSELKEALLTSSSPLALHIHQFQFAGEVRKSGGLRGLAAKVKQVPLPAALADQIWAELDTQTRLARLQVVLEECMTFIVQTGGSTQSLDEGMLLESYILEVLLMRPGKWEEIRCPSLAQHIRLCHLQSLYVSLESQGDDDPLSTVALAYRAPLPEDMLLELQRVTSTGAIDTFVFLPILREFCTEQLSSAAWSEDAVLKEYLTYSSEVDLESLSWFENVPDSLMLKHAYWTYRTISDV